MRLFPLIAVFVWLGSLASVSYSATIISSDTTWSGEITSNTCALDDADV